MLNIIMRFFLSLNFTISFRW